MKLQRVDLCSKRDHTQPTEAPLDAITLEHTCRPKVRTIGSMESNSNKPRPDRKLEFFDVKASTLNSEARRLLKEYSKIPEDQIERHVELIVGSEAPISPIVANMCDIREKRHMIL
jgi:hypothetical protein